MIVIKRKLKIANRIKKTFKARIHETFLFSKQTSPDKYLSDNIFQKYFYLSILVIVNQNDCYQKDIGDIKYNKKDNWNWDT